MDSKINTYSNSKIGFDILLYLYLYINIYIYICVCVCVCVCVRTLQSGMRYFTKILLFDVIFY